MNKPVNIKDIAARAGVSIGSVDRVIHNRGNVAKETEEKIKRALEELGYQPNLLARVLKTGKQHHFAVLLPEATDINPYWNYHLSGIMKAAMEIKSFGALVDVFHFKQNKPDTFQTASEKTLTGEYDAILFVPVFADLALEFVKKAKEKNIHLLAFDTETSLSEVSFVGQHSIDSGRTAAGLISNCVPPGKKIWVVTIAEMEDNHIQFSRRKIGFLNYDLPHHISEINTQPEQLDERLEDSIMHADNAGGIFVTNTRTHLVAAWLQKKKQENIRLIGYDLVKPNIDFLNSGHITYILNQQPEDQGYLGIMKLYRHLVMKQEAGTTEYLPIEIVTKENVKYLL